MAAMQRARLGALRVYRDAMNELTPGTAVEKRSTKKPPTIKAMKEFFNALTKDNARARETLAIEWDKKPQSVWEDRVLDIDEGSFKPAAHKTNKQQK